MTHDSSDDEIWNGLRRRFAAGERLISRPAHWRERNLQQAKPVRRPTRLRVAGAGSLVAVGAVVVLVAVVLGPGSRRPAGPAATSLTPSAPATSTATTSQTLTATQDGLSLTAILDRTSVEPGGKVTIDITVHNGRTTPARYFAPCDGAVEMNTSLSLPLQPAGRTWTGIEGDLKAAALGGTSVPGDQENAIAAAIYSVSCQEGVALWTLAPGQAVESTLVWPAELIDGVPALPGDVPFTIALMGPAGYPAHFTGFEEGQFGYGLMVPIGDQLHVAGTIHIVGQAPKLVSKGQAIDAALADPQFADWLAEQPESTWTVVNMGLMHGGIVPGDWMLEVVRELGAQSNAGTAFVDPHTGKVLLNFCKASCP